MVIPGPLASPLGRAPQRRGDAGDLAKVETDWGEMDVIEGIAERDECCVSSRSRGERLLSKSDTRTRKSNKPTRWQGILLTSPLALPGLHCKPVSAARMKQDSDGAHKQRLRVEASTVDRLFRVVSRKSWVATHSHWPLDGDQKRRICSGGSSQSAVSSLIEKLRSGVDVEPDSEPVLNVFFLSRSTVHMCVLMARMPTRADQLFGSLGGTVVGVSLHAEQI